MEDLLILHQHNRRDEVDLQGVYFHVEALLIPFTVFRQPSGKSGEPHPFPPAQVQLERSGFVFQAQENRFAFQQFLVGVTKAYLPGRNARRDHTVAAGYTATERGITPPARL